MEASSVSTTNGYWVPCSAMSNAHEASLDVNGAKLFNLLPMNIRGLDNIKVDTF